jgi:hypothetical protein
LDQAVILSPREQEYLLRVIETGVAVRAPHEFFLWTQGQLQALLPHQVLVCLQFDGADALVRLVCVHSRHWKTARAAWRSAWRFTAARGSSRR